MTQRGFWPRLRRWLHIGIRPTAEVEIRRLREDQEQVRQAVEFYRRQRALARLDRREKA